IDDVVGFVDVMKSAIPETPNRGVIFFSGDVIVSLIQEFLGTTEAARAVQSRINRWMIVQVLAVVNRSTLNFVDGFVDLVDGVLFLFVHVMSGSQALQMCAGVPQVGKRVQVCRMPSRFVSKAQDGAGGNNKHEQGAMSCSSHSFPRSLSVE
ncbi:MAG TPA: hypothetical protein VEK33_14905, partial [Terriglobales bacterium]|nr:hypothetical protein [Terriglobales bacterium]